jgi:hypothetical protein
VEGGVMPIDKGFDAEFAKEAKFRKGFSEAISFVSV